MKMRFPRLGAGLVALLGAAPALAQDEPNQGSGPVPYDIFNPALKSGELSEPPPPAYGGRVIVHLSSMPEGLCRPLENSAVTRWMLFEMNETLVRLNWETWDYDPLLAESWHQEDTVILRADRAEQYAGVSTHLEREGEGDDAIERHVIYGRVSDGGDAWLVTPLTAGNPIEAEVGEGEAYRIPKSDVERVDEGTVFTFSLRDDVKWHDGHPFNAWDVWFSWDLFNNPDVDCDESRFQFIKVLKGEVLDDYTVRFFYEQQYFAALESIGWDMSILPRHLYDLRDPDCAEHDPEASVGKLADYINDNPRNRNWVGVGPYRMTEYNSQYIEAQRFDGYFDPAGSGYVDTIRWRYIDDDDAAFQALINGELDFLDRVKSEDYFGEATRTDVFKDSYYAGHYYTGTYGFCGWNLYQPHLKDKTVRQALAHAFPFDEYLKTNYKGLAIQVLGPMNYWTNGYNREIEPFEYDLDLAEEMLAEAGWYDRDGDGIIDKDGIPFEIRFTMPSGNKSSTNFGLKYQEELGRIGIKLSILQYDWATFVNKLQDRDFDACNLAWVPTIESDPEQIWHSRWGQPGVRSSNFSGVRDSYIDELIEKGQRELDNDERLSLIHI